MINRYFYFNFLRKTYVVCRKKSRQILGLDDSPESIARGVAIGLFIAFTPTIPLQMVLSILFAFILKANKTAAIVPAWVTNPLTAPPIFYLEYITGAYILRYDLLSKEDFLKYANKVFEFSLFQPSELYQQVAELFKESWGQLGYPMIVGSMIWAIIISISFYFITLKTVIKRRKRKEEKKRLRRAAKQDETN
ncbi:MAG: hypothetical protein COA79_15070 [Planctomycetota bacterium]|nr:MAG: hypothetical protein COA79_15070 [Planctomycetota bacterium]